MSCTVSCASDRNIDLNKHVSDNHDVDDYDDDDDCVRLSVLLRTVLVLIAVNFARSK